MSNRIQLKRSTVASHIPVLGDLAIAEMAFNSNDRALFISDGAAVFQFNLSTNIHTVPSARFVTDAQITAFTGKQDALGYTPVDKNGDTMTGPLVLSGDPTLDNHSVNKQYADQQDALKLNIAGGTLTGALVLNADPTANLQPTTKQYVDTAISNQAGQYAAPVQDIAALMALTSYADKQIRLVEDAGAIFRFDATAIDVADGAKTVIPTNITHPAAGRWFKTSSVAQDHNALTNLQGGAAADYLHLTTAEKTGYDTHLADTELHITSAQNLWIDAINSTAEEVNYLQGVSSSVQTQINSKEPTIGYVPVDVAGDTMTGALTLSADPSGALEASTKQYVDNTIDNAVIDGGTY